MIASGINIGRKRGEFERAAQTMRSVRGGHRDPEAAGLGEIARLADLYTRAAAAFDTQAKEGRLLRGVPDERWLAACAADEEHPNGWTGRELSAEQLHVLLPELRETRVRGGHVFARVKGRDLAWCEPELFAALGSGYRVAVRFDAAEPALGAAILNLEGGTRNRWGWGPGQLLGVAAWEPEAPQLQLGMAFLTEEEEAALGHRRRWDAAVRTEYRAIGAFGRPAARSSEARSGGGATVRRQTDFPQGADRAAAGPAASTGGAGVGREGSSHLLGDRSAAPAAPGRSRRRGRMDLLTEA